MITFECDYNEGAHPRILEALTSTNFEQLAGYGSDDYTEMAKEKIRNVCKAPEADVYFLVGGTQTNQFVIDTTLKSYEGVISATTGHVGGHEAGAIEKSGHKVLTLPEHLGKITSEDLKSYLENFYNDRNHEHMVFPGMVYISYPTEYGTIYTKDELKSIRKICDEYKLPLYIDGARLGYGLMCEEADLTIEDIAALSDVFYIGGTKVGALCGEALVYPKGNAPEHFVALLKQHGALLAKGRLNGIQFNELFKDNLYFDISKHAVDMAKKVKDLFVKKGFKLFIDSPTNQQFIIIDDDVLSKISEKVRYSFWEKHDDHSTVVRFATSWATTNESIDYLEKILGEI